jgi:hypothetical protein
MLILQNSQLYKAQGITINNNWTSLSTIEIETNNADNETDAISNDTNTTSSQQNHSSNPVHIENPTHENEEQVENDECVFDRDLPETVNCGNRDTMLQPNDLIDDSREILSVAPGEGNCPLKLHASR